MEDVRGWFVCVQDEVWNCSCSEATQGRHSRHRHSVAITALSLGASTGRMRRATSSSTEPPRTILALLGMVARSTTARTRRRERATSRSTEPTCMALALLGMLAVSLGASSRRRRRAPSIGTEPTCTILMCFWWFCDFESCDHRAKRSCRITSHKANNHSVGVDWKQCHTGWKTRTTSRLTCTPIGWRTTPPPSTSTPP